MGAPDTPEAPAAVPTAKAPATPAPASPTLAPQAPELPPPAPAVPEIPEAPPLPAGPYEFATGMSAGAFDHERLDATPQVTVHWTNRDSAVHSVVSQDGRFAGSGPISPGSEFTATFLAPGDYPFYCRYHGTMLGTVVVR